MEKSSDLEGEKRFGRRVVGKDDDLGVLGFESRSCWTNIGSKSTTPIQQVMELIEDELVDV